VRCRSGAPRVWGADPSIGGGVDGGAVDVFPAWETLPHERLSPRSDTVARRLRVQRRLTHPAEFPPLRILAMPVRALLQPIAAGLGDLAPVRVRLGDAVDLEALERDLAGAAYSRVDMVERRGEFAVRGGILDVFPPTDPRPSRIELFGDEVEKIRTFSVADQRSLEPVGEVYAPPCREILVDERVRARARGLVKDLPGAVDMLDRIAAGSAPEGMESLAPALVDMVPVLDTLPADARIALVEPERVAQRADSLIATTEEFLAAAWSSAAVTLESSCTCVVSAAHDWKRAFFGSGAAMPSCKVFHSPQCGHLPCHLGTVPPHSVQV